MAAAPPQPSRPRPPDGARSVFVPASIEDQVRLNYSTPAPIAYEPYNPLKPDISEPKRLGKISESNHPHALDHESKNKGWVPGPGSYQTPDLAGFPLPDGGRLNRNAPNERFKLDEYPVPAPGQYGVPNDPTRPRQLNGRFSRDPRVTAFIEDATRRARSIPGPGTHDVLDAQESAKPFCPEGGRYLDAYKPPGYFDMVPKISEGVPDPGHYQNNIDMKLPQGVGRTVYRYESATLQETKGLLLKAVGDANDAPGPGTYAAPQPLLHQPTGNPPSLKGRTLGHGMPHPFAYNCAPDYSRKFLEPVRSQNNGNQIYGVGTRAADKAAKRSGSRGSAKSAEKSTDGFPGTNNDQLEDLPDGVGDDEKIDGEVQWRDGGFAKLKKSRSDSNVKREHPSIKEAAKFYPQLQQHKKRSSNQFLPMASRRSESIGTLGGSKENQKLLRTQWKLGAFVEGIQNATSAALEPLDVEKLKTHAMRGLRDKALNRMKLQGVSHSQQEVIMEEMESLIFERSQPASAHASTMQMPSQEWAAAMQEGAFDNLPAGPQDNPVPPPAASGIEATEGNDLRTAQAGGPGPSGYHS
eukprot:TRINITY_DN227_c1_g1_i1.p1 TRINITY_DN227_c1_g1~~TRINITY_DN227_c1_g1_i1.p1  ORF type:complete len:580 (+),score=122.24 TRINITY_DN227_c1_g1_i1:117-1856(+)